MQGTLYIDITESVSERRDSFTYMTCSSRVMPEFEEQYLPLLMTQLYILEILYVARSKHYFS